MVHLLKPILHLGQHCPSLSSYNRGPRPNLELVKEEERTRNMWLEISNSTYEQNVATHTTNDAVYLGLLNVHGAVESLEVASLYRENQSYQPLSIPIYKRR